MRERQALGVQVVTALAREARFQGGDAAHHVERIAHQRVAGGGQVDPDLVRASRGDGRFDDRVPSRSASTRTSVRDALPWAQAACTWPSFGWGTGPMDMSTENERRPGTPATRAR